MSTTLLQSFREIAEACPCRLGAALCSSHDPAVTDCPCAEAAGYGEAAPEQKTCSWPGHASLRKAAGEMHAKSCMCDEGMGVIVDPDCADLRRRLMEVVG